MKYYKVTPLYNGYNGLVAGALYTRKEIKAMGVIYYEHTFELVRIPKRNTMWYCGNRFEKGGKSNERKHQEN